MNETMVKQSKVEDGLDLIVTEHDYLFIFSDGFSGNVFISKLPEEEESINLPAVDLLEAVSYMLLVDIIEKTKIGEGRTCKQDVCKT